MFVNLRFKKKEFKEKFKELKKVFRIVILPHEHLLLISMCAISNIAIKDSKKYTYIFCFHDLFVKTNLLFLKFESHYFDSEACLPPSPWQNPLHATVLIILVFFFLLDLINMVNNMKYFFNKGGIFFMIKPCRRT